MSIKIMFILLIGAAVAIDNTDNQWVQFLKTGKETKVIVQKLNTKGKISQKQIKGLKNASRPDRNQKEAVQSGRAIGPPQVNVQKRPAYR